MIVMDRKNLSAPGWSHVLSTTNDVAELDRFRERIVAMHETLARSFPWCAQWEEQLNRLFAAYVATKQEQAVLDYDDLLLYWARMMEIRKGMRHP